MVENLISLIEPISKVFKAIVNPLDTLKSFIDLIVIYLPYIAQTMFIFYVVTKSQKILSSMFLVIVVYLLLKVAITLEFTPFLAILLATILLIRLIGGSI